MKNNLHFHEQLLIFLACAAIITISVFWYIQLAIIIGIVYFVQLIFYLIKKK